jgi:hypothetical protein
MPLFMAPRFDRLEPFIPRAVVLEQSATVIGLGTVGRQVALQLVALGVPKLQLIDFATVELADITSAGFLSEDVGCPKVDAVGGLCHRAEPQLQLETICERYQASHAVGVSVFCCVGSNADRELIWEAVRARCWFWGDVRIEAETVRVLVAGDEVEQDRYRRTLAGLNKAVGIPMSVPLPYLGMLGAALVIQQFIRRLQGWPLVKDASFDSATARYSVSDGRA